MKHKGIHIALAVIEALISLGAISGGIAILTGVFDQWFPVAWLQGTPFSDYTIPGLILLIVVGGGMLLTAATQFIQHQWAVLLLTTMGFVMLGWITLEVSQIIKPIYAQTVVTQRGCRAHNTLPGAWTTAMNSIQQLLPVEEKICWWMTFSPSIAVTSKEDSINALVNVNLL